jgi:hypothetical protein
MATRGLVTKLLTINFCYGFLDLIIEIIDGLSVNFFLYPSNGKKIKLEYFEYLRYILAALA